MLWNAEQLKQRAEETLDNADMEHQLKRFPEGRPRPEHSPSQIIDKMKTVKIAKVVSPRPTIGASRCRATSSRRMTSPCCSENSASRCQPRPLRIYPTTSLAKERNIARQDLSHAEHEVNFRFNIASLNSRKPIPKGLSTAFNFLP